MVEAWDWALLRHALAAALVLAGLFFVFVGAIGVLRLPDFYTRLHAAGVTDTLGAELVLLGLMVEAGWSLTTAKLAVIALFLFLTSPTATHAVANAAYQAGVAPMLNRFRSTRPGQEGTPDASSDASSGGVSDTASVGASGAEGRS